MLGVLMMANFALATKECTLENLNFQVQWLLTDDQRIQRRVTSKWYGHLLTGTTETKTFPTWEMVQRDIIEKLNKFSRLGSTNPKNVFETVQEKLLSDETILHYEASGHYYIEWILTKNFTIERRRKNLYRKDTNIGRT